MAISLGVSNSQQEHPMTKRKQHFLHEMIIGFMIEGYP